MLFDFFGFFFGELGFRGGLIFGGVEMSCFLAVLFFGFLVFGKFSFTDDVDFIRVVFFKFGATCKSVGFGFVGGFFVLGFGEFERERCSLLLVQFDFAACRGGIGSGGCWQLERRSGMARRICAVGGKRSVVGNAYVLVSRNGSGLGFGASIGEQPARKSASEATRDGGAT